MKKLLITLTVLATCLSGCATYNEQVWTPDSFGYTLQRDHEDGALSSYFGFNWNLKPEKYDSVFKK